MPVSGCDILICLDLGVSPIDISSETIPVLLVEPNSAVLSE